ncbi:MAG: hypothetical protein LBV26_09120 [Bacteroidales bacterium]|jgi:hypothetical protein|nr:hypothetical protein [Bacteroidales bacterium]
MRKTTAISTLFFLLISYTAVSQKQLNSPYSRFNIGSLEPQGSFKSRAMGGTGVAMRDNNSVYYTNPASYSSLDTNSFSFDFGVDFGMSTMQHGNEKYSSNDANFHHMIIGFPVAKNWGVAAGIVPLSQGYYNISTAIMSETDNGYNAVTGTYTSQYRGNGGFSNLFFGTGVNILKNLSVGVNLTIIFGMLERNSSVAFDDVNSYFINVMENMRMRGFNFDYGLQYTAKLKNDYFLNAGLAFVMERAYKSNYEYYASKQRYNITATANNNTPPYSIDTLDYVSETAAPVKLPQTYRAGIAFGKQNKFTAGFDFTAAPWGEIPGFKNSAANTMTYALGIEYTPDKYSNSSVLKRVEYRLGGRLGDSYLLINNSQLKEKSASFGVGIPLRRSISKVNLYVDYTQKSASSSALHTENIVTVGGSINIYDFWFIKRRYN